jgi:hypothetical protein
VVNGMGGMFSLDNGTGRRFLTRSRIYTDEEAAQLEGKRTHGDSLRGGQPGYPSHQAEQSQ